MDYRKIIRGYYFATPLFFLLEKFTGLEFRVSFFISSPGWRLAYYLFCLICMTAIVWKPRLTHIVGLFESSINIILLFVGAALSWMFPLSIVSEDTHEIILRDGPIGTGAIINFLLAGSLWTMCFRRNVSVLHTSDGSHDPDL